MRACLVVCLAAILAGVSFPVRSETHRNSVPPLAIDCPDAWKILAGEGELLTRAVGPGGAMNVSVAAARRPDFDAERFSHAELDEIAQELAAATAGALQGFELLETGRGRLGGKPAAFFRYRAVVQQPKGPVETIGLYYATAHRGLVYSVTGVTQAKLARRTQPAIEGAIRFETGGPARAE
jgi:hypothetical protein